MKVLLLLIPLLLVCCIQVMGQDVITVSGIVRDSLSKEPLPSVSVYFDGSTIGAVTDMNGKFTLQNSQGYHCLCVSALTYVPRKYNLRNGRKNENLICSLSPIEYALGEVVVKAGKQKYHR